MKKPANYRDVGGWDDWAKLPEVESTAPALLSYWKQTDPQAEFVVQDDGRATYAEVDQRSALLARQLMAAGVGKGTRVGIMIPNSVAFVVTWFAIVRIGATAVTISTLSTPAEIAKIARHSDIHMLFAAERYLHHDYIARVAEAFPGIEAGRAPHFYAAAPYLRDIWFWSDKAPAWASRVDLSAEPRVAVDMLQSAERQVAPADIVSIIYTSGSTAEPKGVIHTHGNFMRQSRKLAAIYPYQRGDRLFGSAPMFWVGGLTVNLLNIMQVGGTLLGSSMTGPALLDFIQNERVNYFTGWPHLGRALASDPSFAARTFPDLRGGSLDDALPPERRAKHGNWFGNSLRMTETCGPHTMYRFEHPPGHEVSSGTFQPGMEHRIVDADSGAVLPLGEMGELQVRGDALTVGMVKRERAEVFTPDGWYGTGDLCSIRDNYLYFHGRVDDMIKSAGANVSPREVETVLAGLPGIAQAMVTGVADRKRGTVVGALLVPKPGAVIDREAVRAAASRQLSAYKVPRVMLVMEASKLPLLSSTKVDRRKLIAMLTEEAERGEG